jgi:hypothetical protein
MPRILSAGLSRMVWMHFSKPPGVKITKRRLISLDMFRQLCRDPLGTVTLVPVGASNTLSSIRIRYVPASTTKCSSSFRWRCIGGLQPGAATDSTIAYVPFVFVLESRTAIRSPAVPSYQGPVSVAFSRDDVLSLTIKILSHSVRHVASATVQRLPPRTLSNLY